MHADQHLDTCTKWEDKNWKGNGRPCAEGKKETTGFAARTKVTWWRTGGGGLSPQGQVAGWGHSWLGCRSLGGGNLHCGLHTATAAPTLVGFPDQLCLQFKGHLASSFSRLVASKSEMLTIATSAYQAYTTPCLFAGLWPNIHYILRLQHQGSQNLEVE